MISESVKATIKRFDLVLPGERMLVAVSGGPDSVALLHVLSELREELSLGLEVAHLQHGIRGQEATEDARFVADLAKTLNVPFHVREIDLPQMKSEAGKGNLEALGRAERYRFFAEVASERRIDKVVTAHTLDDQAETVAMWFLRGAGLKGLGGMSPLQLMDIGGYSLVLVRPLLEIPKSEILDYLEENGLDYRSDRTNQDQTLLRNWLRLDLLPRIQQRFDSRVPARLGQQAEIFRDEDALLDGLAQKHLAAMSGPDAISREKFLAQPRALQRRILRRWIERTRGHLRGLEFVHIDDLLRLIEQGPPQGRLSIPGGWEMIREYNWLTLEKQGRNRSKICYSYPLILGAILRIPEAKLELHNERLAAAPNGLPNDPMEAVFDLARLDQALSIRNFRHGDRFQPLGMSGHKKIKDLFIEKRVPLSIRACWPLLAAGAEIIWIPGYARSATAVVSTKTTSVLHLKARSV